MDFQTTLIWCKDGILSYSRPMGHCLTEPFVKKKMSDLKCHDSKGFIKWLISNCFWLRRLIMSLGNLFYSCIIVMLRFNTTCKENICRLDFVKITSALLSERSRQVDCHHIVFNSLLYSYVMDHLQNMLFLYALHLQKLSESI